MTRIAIVGCGAHAREHAHAFMHLRSLGRELSLGLVIDRNAERARSFAAEFDADGWSTETDALESERIDAVDICTPTDEHVGPAMAAARAGKATLVEKPLAGNLDDVQLLARAFEAASVPLFPGLSTRFDPVSRRVDEAIRAGEVGQVAAIRVQVFHGYAWPGGWRAWQLDEQRSGGRILHLGIHDIDLICWLMRSAPVEISAYERRTGDGRLSRSESYTALLRFRDDSIALLTGDWEVVPANVLRRTVFVVGSEGQLRYDSTDDEDERSSTGTPDRWPTYDDAIRNQLAHWLDCVDGQAKPLATIGQASIAIEVALRIQQSARNGGEPVSLEPASYTDTR